MAGKLNISEVKLISPNGLVEKSITMDNAGVVYVDGKEKANVTDVIGLNQTYQNVFASRANNTTYTNSTGKPILVFVAGIYLADSNDRTNYVYVNDVAIMSFHTQSNITGIFDFPISFIVPNGATYKVNIYHGIRTWFELR